MPLALRGLVARVLVRWMGPGWFTSVSRSRRVAVRAHTQTREEAHSARRGRRSVCSVRVGPPELATRHRQRHQPEQQRRSYHRRHGSLRHGPPHATLRSRPADHERQRDLRGLPRPSIESPLVPSSEHRDATRDAIVLRESAGAVVCAPLSVAVVTRLSSDTLHSNVSKVCAPVPVRDVHAGPVAIEGGVVRTLRVEVPSRTQWPAERVACGWIPAKASNVG